MAMHEFPPIAAFQPLINGTFFKSISTKYSSGVGGNLVAVQASRIGTRLHQARKNKESETNSIWTYANPWRAFFKIRMWNSFPLSRLPSDEDSITARLLLIMAFPGIVVFVQVVFLLDCGFNNSFLFTIGFLIVGLIQVRPYVSSKNVLYSDYHLIIHLSIYCSGSLEEKDWPRQCCHSFTHRGRRSPGYSTSFCGFLRLIPRVQPSWSQNKLGFALIALIRCLLWFYVVK